MPANLNPRATELLTWHGHSSGGVHVPFQRRGNPIGETIATSLVQRLRALAQAIASDPSSQPRWVFLVGGPGNGKSETVQDFLACLDSNLGMDGTLVRHLTDSFNAPGLLPRKIDITTSDLGSNVGNFASHVGRLVVVQDATATDRAEGDAAKELADDITDLFTIQATAPLPVVVICANRGLLARVMNEAFHDYGPDNDVTHLVSNVVQASSLGSETLAGRKPCWPLGADPRFACWPLDVESLIVPGAEGASPPVEYMIRRAVDVQSWEVQGRCEDCQSRELCPLRQNAAWLRDDTTRGNLLTLLRHGELARGQRWNFRDAFSLVAELLIGQWSDFSEYAHPCEWVHSRVTMARRSPPDARSLVALALKLYQHAVFRGTHTKSAATALLESGGINEQLQPLTHQLLSAIANDGQVGSIKPIREILARDYSRLDPATATPADTGHPLRPLEEEFCQSVEQGRTATRRMGSTSLEDSLLELFEGAEREWDLLGRDSKSATQAVCVLRKVAGMLSKRAVGVRLGCHAMDELLADYEACLHDNARLAGIQHALRPLLGEHSFRFNLVEILGQPRAEGRPRVSLEGPAPGARPLPAPRGTATTPGHDVPCIEVNAPSYRIPLTFDFYHALRLRKDGCAGSSLPASVRAALDRLRHRYAGELCRDEEKFLFGRATIDVGGSTIGVSAAGAAPTLADRQ